MCLGDVPKPCSLTLGSYGLESGGMQTNGSAKVLSRIPSAGHQIPKTESGTY